MDFKRNNFSPFRDNFFLPCTPGTCWTHWKRSRLEHNSEVTQAPVGSKWFAHYKLPLFVNHDAHIECPAPIGYSISFRFFLWPLTCTLTEHDDLIHRLVGVLIVFALRKPDWPPRVLREQPAFSLGTLLKIEKYGMTLRASFFIHLVSKLLIERYGFRGSSPRANNFQHLE